MPCMPASSAARLGAALPLLAATATMGPWLLSARAMVCLLLMLVLLVQAAGGQGTACTFDIAGTFRSFQLSHGCGVATPPAPSPAPPAPAQALTYYVAA
eukprot:SAG25_NODE_7059_length_508_cov_1.797066_1_plen_98_part_01